MSRFYRMGVVVSNVEPDEAPKIYDALMHEWSFDENDYFYYANDKSIDMCGESNLCGGEEEEEFAHRIARAVWAAIGRYVEVTVHATYLEDLPYDTYSLGEDDYGTWIDDQREDEDDSNEEEEQAWCQQAFEAFRNADQLNSIAEHPANTDDQELTPEQADELRAVQRQALEEWNTPEEEIERLMALDDPSTTLANLSLPDQEFVDEPIDESLQAVHDACREEHFIDQAAAMMGLAGTERLPEKLEAKIEKYRKPKRPKRKLNIPEVNDEKAEYTWGKGCDPWSSEEEGGETETT